MKVFVVTPHYSDPAFDEKKASVLRMAKRYRNIEVIYGSNTGSEEDIDKSIALLESADSVLGDLSLERPSCYFEVGFAQSRNKLVYLIARRGTEIHQVKSKRKVKFYIDLSEYEQVVDFFFEALSSNSV